MLTSLAALYGVSLDYLAGIDKREMISSEGLSDAQRSLVQTIVVELQSPNPHGARTLTPRQLDILNSLLYEFTKDR